MVIWEQLASRNRSNETRHNSRLRRRRWVWVCLRRRPRSTVHQIAFPCSATSFWPSIYLSSATYSIERWQLAWPNISTCGCIIVNSPKLASSSYQSNKICIKPPNTSNNEMNEQVSTIKIQDKGSLSLSGSLLKSLQKAILTTSKWLPMHSISIKFRKYFKFHFLFFIQ